MAEATEYAVEDRPFADKPMPDAQPEVRQPQPLPQSEAAIAQRLFQKGYEGFESAIPQREAISKEQVEALKEGSEIWKRAAPGIKEAQAGVTEAAKNIPDVPIAPPHPKPSDYINKDKANILMGIASLIGGIGMFNGRMRGVQAMALANGAVRGMIDGDRQKYNDAMKEYEDLVKEQAITYQQQSQRYNQILTSSKLNLEEKFRAYELEARSANDRAAIAAAEGKNIDAAIKHDEELMKTGASILQHVETEKMNRERLNMQEQLARERLGFEREKLGVEREKLERERTGKPTPAQERQELTTLLKSYQDEAKGLQKKIDSYHIFNPPADTTKRMDEVQAEMAKIRHKLATMSGLPGGEAAAETPQEKPPEVMRSVSKSGKPIWKMPNETTWHYE
jgi:hypothetical protein